MKRLLTLTVALAVIGLCFTAHAFQEIATVQIPNMRFYSVKAIGPLSGGSLNLIAAGQIHHENRNDALMIAYSLNRGAFKEIAREVFRIGLDGNTRIRSSIPFQRQARDMQLIVVNGKGGPEHHEKAFIRSYGFNGKAFQLIDSMEFSDPETSYTHGYPLIQTDVDGDGKKEIVYGGFAGEQDRDHADIRLFSIGGNGHLSPMRGYPKDQLNDLPLRVNALTSGDLDGDGIQEVVAAGRTVEDDVEHAAFAVFSRRKLVWKRVKDLGSCRYRHAAVTKTTGGERVLVLAGRINQGDTHYALLDLWQCQKGEMRLISRIRFTGAGSTRLRLVEPLPGLPGRLIIGGRLEIIENGGLRWQGFLQEISAESGTLSFSSKPVVLDKDWETRVRTMDIMENLLITGGFTENRHKMSTGFISRYQLQ